MKKYIISILLSESFIAGIRGQDIPMPDSLESMTLEAVTVKARSNGKLQSKVTNTEVIGQGELIRAACCNLGESFTTNPSVDVSYGDAATGARQIKLLGLSGTYVQILTENMPNLRGASIPYSLGYVPGSWIQSIQVSKGASSVKNGYESTTGQINIEYLKPQGIDGVRANAYLDSDLKQEVNVDGRKHLTERLSTSALFHFENRQTDHDSNGDGFMDIPKLRQYNGMWRMAYVSPAWISQFSFKGMHDERESGMSHHHTVNGSAGSSQANDISTINYQPLTIDHYGIGVTTNRFEAQWKNGFTLDREHSTSIALMLNGSIHDAMNMFGRTQYDVNQKNGYAHLMFETDFSPKHNLNVGASLNYDKYDETYDTNKEAFLGTSDFVSDNSETTSGLYAQYTYKLADKLSVMSGVRWDYSSMYGGFWTPRLHIKYTPWNHLTLRASVGKGYRSPHALAENVSLLASGKEIIIEKHLKQEEAWNTGISASLNFPVAGRNLEVNADYYYTDFSNQMVVIPDGAKGPNTFFFGNLSGLSYSHTAQIDVTYPFFSGFTVTGAFRYIDSRVTYDGVLRLRPLTSRYKGLLTMSYKTNLELWHFDVTGSINGGGELYDRSNYPAYFQLQAQVTREFRLFSIYIGGENVTNYAIKAPILSASNPWSSTFDATQVWGPTHGAMGYIGVRFKLEKI